jgi:hypothetical protein
MACPKSSDLDIYVFFVDMGVLKGPFLLYESLNADIKCLSGFWAC